ncbi:MAG: type II CRISPR-associated endonuclease Cas1 [Bacteroidetes bacterium]|nr:type II CRISPR-associated endonuclease Cas1 [Bacteroidota bacterium]
MIKRTIYFGNPARLSLKDNQLNIDIKNDANESITKRIPVEDIGIIVIDHPQITITSGIIQALQSNNVSIITCDERHLPQSLLLPLDGHSIQQERYEAQLQATEPLKKQLWAQTIIQKIKNQHTVLSKYSAQADYLIPYYKNVKSGDSENCEAAAASHYWKTIFASHTLDFKRERYGEAPNNFLNYGYSILRGTMARSIVSAGLLPTLGIFHRNRYNAFCLADDLMEPYRPYVDDMVYVMIKEFGLVNELQKEHKAVLLKIPAIDVLIDGEKSPLMLATQRTAVSLVKCFLGEQRKLVYPEI